MHQLIYYSGLFGLSVIFTLLYVYQWHKQLDVHLTIIFILLPIVNLSYLLMYTDHEPETAVAMIKIIYLGGSFYPWLLTMCVLKVCNIEINRVIKLGTLALNATVFLTVLTIGHTPAFYRSIFLQRDGSVWIQQKEYGPFHTLYYVFVLLYLLTDVSVICYTYVKKRPVSSSVLAMLFLPIPITVFSYFLNHATLIVGYEIMPLTYVLDQILFLLIAHRMVYYNVSEMAVESIVQNGETGFITVDLKGRYLGCNETAKVFLPELRLLSIDQSLEDTETPAKHLVDWLDRFWRDPESGGNYLYTQSSDDGAEEKIYAATVSYLYDGKKRCGYQICIVDDTRNQKYIRLMDQYNSDLQADVAEKTEKIVSMQDHLVLGMASMVESRDNSTGGHIRRTSEGVRILIESIKEGGEFDISDDFCNNIIKAAPMHDLGKIAVDDAILRKPGIFTPEEREVMKKHAAEGAKIVHEILEDTDDEEFRKIAENVAHYHHERVDGSGYPDGLKGDEIPLEARIMAIADVYDALVSKRVYKEKFSFDKANQIILEGMDSQFDGGLKPYYEAARPKLEEYYTAH